MLRSICAAAVLSAALACPAAAASVDCLVSPFRVVALAFGSAGVVRSIEVDRGERVRKGQVLANLDASVEQATLDIAEGQLAATAAVHSAESQLNLAAKKLQRNEELFRRGALAAGQLEDVQAAFDLAQLKLAELQEAKRLQALDVARTKAVIALRGIASPFDAVVVERYAQPGEFIDNKPVLAISEVDRLFIDMIAPAAAFASVKPEQAIAVTLDHPAGRVVQATASIIDPFVDASSGTFRIRATLPNPELAIVPGFRCRAELPLPEVPAP